ncbi:stage II sporulation protein M [Halomonadaceae bacterium KBTZ08]
MKQEIFEQRHQQEWERFEQDLTELEKSRHPDADALDSFPARYRQMCQLLAIAQERGYRTDLVERLNALVLRGHHQLYRFNTRFWQHLVTFILVGFPVLVRQEWKMVAVASAVFVLPGLLFYLAVLIEPSLIYGLLDAAQVTKMEDMYNPASERFGSDRASDSDVMMFGYYIYNNISVAFRCFASGLVFMLGSVFMLLFNGLLLGGVAAHLQNLGYTSTFFPFVIGHGAFELTAIALAGAAGLKLGYSLLVPGSQSRLSALKDAGQTAIRLVYGVILMLIIAAFVEAFWSSNHAVTDAVKYGVGTACWLFVLLYLTRAGRSHEA